MIRIGRNFFILACIHAGNPRVPPLGQNPAGAINNVANLVSRTPPNVLERHELSVLALEIQSDSLNTLKDLNKRALDKKERKEINCLKRIIPLLLNFPGWTFGKR